MFLFLWVCLVSPAHMVPTAEALQRALQTQVICAEWLWQTPQLCGPCGEALHMTLQTKTAAVGCVQRCCPQRCDLEPQRCCAALQKLHPLPAAAVFVVQLPNHVWLFATPWTATRQASLSFTISWSLLRLTSMESVMPSNHHILCCSLLPALSLSQHQGLFQWVGSSLEVAILLELQFQHQSFQWIFRVDFL